MIADPQPISLCLFVWWWAQLITYKSQFQGVIEEASTHVLFRLRTLRKYIYFLWSTICVGFFCFVLTAPWNINKDVPLSLYKHSEFLVVFYISWRNGVGVLFNFNNTSLTVTQSWTQLKWLRSSSLISFLSNNWKIKKIKYIVRNDAQEEKKNPSNF